MESKSNHKLNEQMAEEKNRILKYLEEQMEIKLDALKQYELPIKQMADKSPSEMESFLLRHEIYELKKHISVIKML